MKFAIYTPDPKDEDKLVHRGSVESKHKEQRHSTRRRAVEEDQELTREATLADGVTIVLIEESDLKPAPVKGETVFRLK